MVRRRAVRMERPMTRHRRLARNAKLLAEFLVFLVRGER